jgi:signal transduction histidine kinase/CheY-like chemotaxis protein
MQWRHLGTKTLVDVSSSTFLIRDTETAEPRGYAIVTRDITERRHLEAQFRESQKMEAIGQLSGGIAHDFNNILGAILGNAQLAALDLEVAHSARVCVDEIIRAGLRAKKLVQQILTFSRRQPSERKVLHLESVLEESLSLLRATLPAGVDLVTSLDPATPNVMADPTQIHQVILNLCTNAWHALEDRPGRIEIFLEKVCLDETEAAALSGIQPGAYARLSVSDTGKGMDSATLERIYEPFFSTKAPGEGTGLGLSVVHGIIKGHDAAITASSVPGQGTAFHLYFPAVEIEAEAVPAEALAAPRGRGQRILYLDDEAALVSFASRALGRLGYEVSGFTHPVEAVQAFRANPQQFDVVMTDFNMPGQSGLQVAAELLAIRPGLPVVLSSGFISEEFKRNAQRVGIRHLIYKPNTIDGLGRVLGDILQKRP